LHSQAEKKKRKGGGKRDGLSSQKIGAVQSPKRKRRGVGRSGGRRRLFLSVQQGQGMEHSPEGGEIGGVWVSWETLGRGEELQCQTQTAGEVMFRCHEGLQKDLGGGGWGRGRIFPRGGRKVFILHLAGDWLKHRTKTGGRRAVRGSSPNDRLDPIICCFREIGGVC